MLRLSLESVLRGVVNQLFDMNAKIRRASPNDCNQILDIYRPIVERSVISFETVSPDNDEMARRIESVLNTHEWLVVEFRGEIAGYSYASQYRRRDAYKYSTETTVYVRESCRGQGFGRLLYDRLFESLDSLGFHQAYAAIALPNDASIALHKATGFQHIGVFRDAGQKFGRWHDVSWWQRRV